MGNLCHRKRFLHFWNPTRVRQKTSLRKYNKSLSVPIHFGTNPYFFKKFHLRLHCYTLPFIPAVFVFYLVHLFGLWWFFGFWFLIYRLAWGVLHINFKKQRNLFQKFKWSHRERWQGGGTSKSGVTTGKSIHAILSCSLTQVLQLFVMSSRPRHPHSQPSLRSYFLISHFSDANFCYLWCISAHFFRVDFSFPAGLPNSFPASLVCYAATLVADKIGDWTKLEILV